MTRPGRHIARQRHGNHEVLAFQHLGGHHVKARQRTQWRRIAALEGAQVIVRRRPLQRQRPQRLGESLDVGLGFLSRGGGILSFPGRSEQFGAAVQQQGQFPRRQAAWHQRQRDRHRLTVVRGDEQ